MVIAGTINEKSNPPAMLGLSLIHIYNGWRLVITDAAAGSRFYVMEKTIDVYKRQISFMMKMATCLTNVESLKPLHFIAWIFVYAIPHSSRCV